MIRPYCYLEAARGTTMYQISDEATRATASQSKRPLSVSQRRMLIVIAQRIHCTDVLFIGEPPLSLFAAGQIANYWLLCAFALPRRLSRTFFWRKANGESE
jgi:hypothetical protein